MKLTVTDAAKQWGITRNTIYNNINNGKLSRDANKMIDVAEMIRVFGEPKKNTRIEANSNTQNLASSITQVNTHELQYKLELEQLKNKHLEELLQKQELVNKDYRQQIEHYQRQIEQLNDNLSKANTSIQELAHNRMIGVDHKYKKQEEQVLSSQDVDKQTVNTKIQQAINKEKQSSLNNRRKKLFGLF